MVEVVYPWSLEVVVVKVVGLGGNNRELKNCRFVEDLHMVWQNIFLVAFQAATQKR